MKDKRLMTPHEVENLKRKMTWIEEHKQKKAEADIEAIMSAKETRKRHEEMKEHRETMKLKFCYVCNQRDGAAYLPNSEKNHGYICEKCLNKRMDEHMIQMPEFKDRYAKKQGAE